jgi:ceramide glucosyltransferase
VIAVRGVLFFLVIAGCGYGLFSLFCVMRFFASRKEEKDANTAIGSTPVSILKPLKGLDPSGPANLLSFCTQDYPSYEVLFGFCEEDDPALPFVRKIAASAPLVRRIVVHRERQGPNRKVSNLEALVAEAHCPLLAISDSDMRADKSYLAQVTKEFEAGNRTGMVTCLYKISDPTSVGSALESYTIALDFIPSVLVARRIEGVTFGLGASMLMAKTALEDIGGFGDIAGYLADDYQLGFRLWRKGYVNIISKHVIENRVGAMTVKDHVLHQMRWARTYRASRPAGYLGYGITHVLCFALLQFVVSPSSWSAAAVFAALAIRYGTALAIHRRVIRARTWLKWLPLLPLKDILSFFIWAWSFMGSTVTWRGIRYRLVKGGKIVEV